MNNISLKSQGPWYTIEADDHDDGIRKLLALLGDAAPKTPCSLPTLIGLAQVWYEAELSIGLAGVAAAPVPQAQPVATVTQRPWDNAPASVAPATQPGAPVTSTAPGGGSDLPPGVKIWQAPDPKKPQYQATWFTLPFIKDSAAGEAFRAPLKSQAWAKWNGEQGDASAWSAKRDSEAFIRQHFIQNAHLFQ